MARARPYPIPTRRYPKARPPAKRRRLSQQASGIAALALLMVVLMAVAIGPLVAPFPPNEIETAEALQHPDSVHLLGTDMFGRDVLSRVLHGGRSSLGAGATAVFLGVCVGTLLGVVAGYGGGLLDVVISAAADILLAFPGLLLALVIAWLFGRGIEKVAIAVGIASAPAYMRLARASVRRLRRAPFVRAAQAVGARDVRILLRHILPNIASPIISLAVLDLGWAVLHVSALSFLGVGAQPPQAEWGAMLSEARAYIRQAPWLGLAPGAAIAVTVFAVNLLGDSLQDSLDPLSSMRL